MPGFERAATIDRPPAQVYAVLDDIQGARAWMPAIRKVEVLTPGFAVDVGYRWRETRRVMGIFRMSADLEVAEHEPPHRWGLKYEDKTMRAMARFRLEPSGRGTLITLREDLEDLRGNAKRAQRMAKWMEKSDDDLLLRLKAHVESQARWPDQPAPRRTASSAEAQDPAMAGLAAGPAPRKPRAAKPKPVRKAAAGGAGGRAPKKPSSPKRAGAKRPAKSSAGEPAATVEMKAPGKDA